MEMEIKTTPTNAGRQQDGKWAKGKSGNPRGKPVGTRNHISLFAEQLLADQTQTLVTKLIEMALTGDPIAMKLCIDRILPPLKSKPVSIGSFNPRESAFKQLMEAFVTALARGLDDDQLAAWERIIATFDSLGRKQQTEKFGIELGF